MTMPRSLTRFSIVAAFSCLPLFACSSGSGDNNNADGGDTDTESDTGTSLDGYDCEFTVAQEPFEIRAVSGGHIAFPDVTRLTSGEILLVYRQATAHGVDPAGAIVGQFGSTDGLTWSPVEILHDIPDVDDRDPSVTTLASGEVAMSYFQYVYQDTPDGDMSVHQIFHGTSDDQGETWGNFSMVPTGDGYAMEYDGAAKGDDLLWQDGVGTPVLVTACSNQPVQLGDTLIVQNYGGYAWNTANSDAPRSRISLFSSDDDGASWSENVIAAQQETDTWLQEPALLAIDANRWLVHLRTAPGSSPGNPGTMWQVRSDNGGQTWGDYEKFDFIGHAPFLYRLSNGVTVSAFRWLNSGYTSTNVNFIYSMDNGETWSEMISILEPQITEVGYPSILELDGNRMLIVYYVGGLRIEGVIYEFELVEAN